MREFRSVAGVLVVDKPAGPTSHDVVDKVRGAIGANKAGHTGTLDPFATGVLPVCLGKATRLARFLAQGDKLYRAKVRLGFATTTDDCEGDPLGLAVPVSFPAELLRSACAALVGDLMQRPPAYSAKRVAGRRAYALARGGGAPSMDAVPVTVHGLDVVAVQGEMLEIEVRCSPGTYVRSLARDLGSSLGVGGHLAALRRLRSGPFGLERAVSWDEISRAVERIVPIDELLVGYPAVRVGPDGREAVRHGRDLGRELTLSGFPGEPPPERLRIVDETGVLLALAVPRGFSFSAEGLAVVPMLHPEVVLIAS